MYTVYSGGLFTYKDTDSMNFLGIFMSFRLVQLPSIYEYFIIIIIIKLPYSFPLKFLKKKVDIFSGIFWSREDKVQA